MKERIKKVLVLVVEVGEINNKIFDDKHMGKRGYNGGFGSVGINRFEAGHCVASINVHGTRSTYTFSTRPSVA